MNINKNLLQNIEPIVSQVESVFHIVDDLKYSMSLRLLCNPSHINSISLNSNDFSNLTQSVATSRDSISDDLKPLLTTLESDLRYGWIDEVLLKCSFKKIKVIDRETRSEKLDKILTHRFFGPLIFVAILYFIFQSIFTWASVPMDLINNLIGGFGEWVLNTMPSGLLRDLIVDATIRSKEAKLFFP